MKTAPPAAMALALAAMLLPACSSSPKGSVSEKEMVKLRAAGADIHPGMSKKTVMEKLKGANFVRLASTNIDGATIEEWKGEAFHDSNKGRDLAVRFLYYRNDILVDMSDTRIDFRNDPALIKRWADQKAE